MPFTSETAKKARCRKGGLHAQRVLKQRYPDHAEMLRKAAYLGRVNYRRQRMELADCKLCRTGGEALERMFAYLQAMIAGIEQGTYELTPAERRIIMGYKR